MSKVYHGYVSNISLNDEVVHGLPHKDRLLCAGDLVKVDVCASLAGYCADMTRCYFVDQVPQTMRDFVQTAQNALDKAIACAVKGRHLSDIAAAVQGEVEGHGYGVVRAFAGHGIGKQMHEDPEVLNYGPAGKGPRLAVGTTLVIEPMITMGRYEVYVASDGWTVKTKDGSLAAHVEDTVAVTEHGPRVFTRI
jgi:methionyl aminopeptidase